MATVGTNGNKMSLYDSLRQSGATTLLENLQSQLKQRNGEITQLQVIVNFNLWRKCLKNKCTVKKTLKFSTRD